MNEKNAGKSKGNTYKITHISVGNCSRVTKLVSNNSKTQYFYLMGRYENKFIRIFMNFDEIIINQ